MPRLVKEAEYAEKRKEILDSALRFIYVKGYEQMTIQDILTDLKISKGAFYHYFDSKQAVLNALTDSMIDEMEQLVAPLTDDNKLDALEKLQRFFDMTIQWKSERANLMIAIVQVWYADDNAIVRQKLRLRTTERLAFTLNQFVTQGIDEALFTTKYPNQAGDLILSLSYGLQDTLARLVLQAASHPETDHAQEIVMAIDAFMDALERVVGAPSNSLFRTTHAEVTRWLDIMYKDSAG